MFYGPEGSSIRGVDLGARQRRVKSLHPPEQLGRSDLEAACEAEHPSKRRRSDTSLQLADVGSSAVDVEGELLLGETVLFPQFAKDLAEGRLDRRYLRFA